MARTTPQPVFRVGDRVRISKYGWMEDRSPVVGYVGTINRSALFGGPAQAYVYDVLLDEEPTVYRNREANDHLRFRLWACFEDELEKVS